MHVSGGGIRTEKNNKDGDDGSSKGGQWLGGARLMVTIVGMITTRKEKVVAPSSRVDNDDHGLSQRGAVAGSGGHLDGEKG